VFVLPRLSRAHPTLHRAEEALGGLVRPNRIEGLPQVTEASANGYFGSYRPPSPPRRSGGVAREVGERYPNSGWGVDRVVRVPNDTHRPVSAVVGVMEARRNAQGEALDDGVGDVRFEQEDVRALHARINTLEGTVSHNQLLVKDYADSQLDDMRGQLDDMGGRLVDVNGQLSQVLQLLQEDRRVDQHEQDRRRPHDNHGRPPRNDGSDDDGDDDLPRPPGARVRRPATPTIPSANNLDVTGPTLATIRPIVNVEPEQVRTPTPAPGPAGQDPDPVYPVGQIAALIRERQIHPQWPTADAEVPDPPTPESAFRGAEGDESKYIATFAEMKLAMESLKKHYDEYTASESHFLFSGGFG
jgi:TolA-binding protein